MGANGPYSRYFLYEVVLGQGVDAGDAISFQTAVFGQDFSS
ncbi:hypothetical protein [Paenibacillus sp. NPDC057934]